jgi:hypothetical protein
MPANACEALEKILEACGEKAGKLRHIFEKIVPGENEAWEQRYVKVVLYLNFYKVFYIPSNLWSSPPGSNTWQRVDRSSTIDFEFGIEILRYFVY